MTDTIDTTGTYEARIAVGCAELPPGMNRAAYFRKLHFLEMRLPGDDLPAPRVAERWRATPARASSRWSPGALSSFHQPRTRRARCVRRALRRDCRPRRRRGGGVRHPAKPSPLERESRSPPPLLHRVASRAIRRRDDTAGESGVAARRTVAPHVAAAFAAELGIVAAIDPLAGDPLEDGIPDAPDHVAYARVTGMGRPGRPLGADDLAQLADWAAASRRAFIAFATPSRIKDAIALARSLT